MMPPTTAAQMFIGGFDGEVLVRFRRLGQLASFGRTSCCAFGVEGFLQPKTQTKCNCLCAARAALACEHVIQIARVRLLAGVSLPRSWSSRSRKLRLKDRPFPS